MADDFDQARRGPPVPRPRRSGGWFEAAAIYGGAALVGTMLFQSSAKARAQSEHPPIGRFIDADGTTLHYVDIGEGRPIVFLHGVATTLEDWFISTVPDLLLPDHRLIVVDRPGYGYSARPSNATWTAERQARSVARMLHRLGAHDAVIVGHSFGVLPAVALALQHPEFARALVLIAGAYYPGASVGALAAALPSVPLLGPLARATVGPSMARSAIPKLSSAMFEPQPVTERFRRMYPAGLATRPSQIEASADDTAALDATTARMAPHYGQIDCPVTVVTGSGDGIVDPDRQSRRFAEAVGHARLIVVRAGGHMVHHSEPSRVAAAIVDTASGRAAEDDPGPAPDLSTGTVDEDMAAAAQDRSKDSSNDEDALATPGKTTSAERAQRSSSTQDTRSTPAKRGPKGRRPKTR